MEFEKEEYFKRLKFAKAPVKENNKPVFMKIGKISIGIMSPKTYKKSAPKPYQRKGSFHIVNAKAHSAKHNSREDSPKYLIDPSANNYYELITNDKDFIAEAKAIYQEKIGRRMQAKQVENLVKETVLTIKPDHTEKDIKELFKKLNKKYGGHELLEVSIHRDEGYFLKNGIAYYPTKNILKKEDGNWYICSNTAIQKPTKNDFDKKVDISQYKKIYNYHAHAKFTLFDRDTGKSARLNRTEMRERYELVCDTLGLMSVSRKDKKVVSKTVEQVKDEHLARAREKEQQAEQLKLIQAAQKEIVAELQTLKAKRPVYAKNEEEIKKVKELISEDFLTTDGIKKWIENRKKEAREEALEAIKPTLDELETVKKERDKAKKDLDELKNAQNAQISQEVTNLKAKLAEALKIAKNATDELETAKNELSEALKNTKNDEISELQEKVKELKAINGVLAVNIRPQSELVDNPIERLKKDTDLLLKSILNDSLGTKSKENPIIFEKISNKILKQTIDFASENFDKAREREVQVARVDSVVSDNRKLQRQMTVIGMQAPELVAQVQAIKDKELSELAKRAEKKQKSQDLGR